MKELKVGDTIRCHDKDDMLNVHESLEKAGVMTDFRYEKDGEKGLWIEVTAVE